MWSNHFFTFVILKEIYILLSVHFSYYLFTVWKDGKTFPLISIGEAGGELLKMMKHGNSWYFNQVKEGFIHPILSYIRADIRLHQCIECLSVHII